MAQPYLTFPPFNNDLRLFLFYSNWPTTNFVLIIPYVEKTAVSYRKGIYVAKTNPLFFLIDNETAGKFAGIKHAFSGNLSFKYFLLPKWMVVMVVVLTVIS